jgi:hypothetical protein
MEDNDGDQTKGSFRNVLDIISCRSDNRDNLYQLEVVDASELTPTENLNLKFADNIVFSWLMLGGKANIRPKIFYITSTI